MGVGVVGLAENKATQPSLAGASAELGKTRKLATSYNWSDTSINLLLILFNHLVLFLFTGK